MRYNLTDLRLFVAVADAGNVSRGAAACFLAPSTASLRIKHLEETLGVELFQREPRGVKLTRAGHVMLEHCRRCLAELEQMHADLAPYARGVKGQVTIFANSTAVSYFLPDELATFLRARPSVRVNLEERVSHDIVSAVADGRADLGVATWDDEHPELHFHDYREDHLMVLMPIDVQLGTKEGARLVDCLRHPFVSMQSGMAIHTFLVNRASALSLHMDVRVQVASFPAAVSLVRAGAGIAILPRWAVLASPTPGVRAVKLLEPWAIRHLRVCWRKEESLLSDNAHALLRQLRGESEES